MNKAFTQGHKFQDAYEETEMSSRHAGIPTGEDAMYKYEDYIDDLRTYSAKAAHTSPPKEVNYYDVGGIETIDYIKAKLTPEQYKGYLLGNILKYSSRLNHKGCAQKDAVKLQDYTTWLGQLLITG
jgi:hypothetical protein